MSKYRTMSAAMPGRSASIRSALATTFARQSSMVRR
jgi:hypothetical protein